MKWDGRGWLREREYSAPWFCAVKKMMTRKVCNRNHSNESKTMRHTESQMQRAPVHEDLLIFTIESIKDLEPRYFSFQWRNCSSCATNIGFDSSRISDLLQEPTFFLLRQRSDSDQSSGSRTAPGQVPRTCQPEPPGFSSKFRHKPEPNLTWGL